MEVRTFAYRGGAWSGALAVLIVPLSFLVQNNLFSLIVVFCIGLAC